MLKAKYGATVENTKRKEIIMNKIKGSVSGIPIQLVETVSEPLFDYSEREEYKVIEWAYIESKNRKIDEKKIECLAEECVDKLKASHIEKRQEQLGEEDKEELLKLREKVEKNAESIGMLLGDRMDNVRKIGVLKTKSYSGVEDKEKKEEVIETVKRTSGLCERLIKDIYMPLLNYSEREQYKILEYVYRKSKIWDENKNIKEMDVDEKLEDYLKDIDESRKEEEIRRNKNFIEKLPKKIDDMPIEELDKTKEKLEEAIRKINEIKYKWKDKRIVV